ncbi:hypothetical protein ACPT8I_07955 [Lactiplantibacillus plantarum]|uniref:hypothetical protein n=1 Tax=Lactiplantibacillus plantarum TaxID=1590 RepID=UPI0025732F64|nr:hypothetical protein [Lactiplantibacillus plantarum]BEI48154.1 hypothetical protein IYO2065_26580 [Lactiplantibacillus plantarum]
MENIQDEGNFVQNLKNNNSRLVPLIINSEFYFKPTGNYAYYDDKQTHAWNQEGMVVTVAADQESIESWKTVESLQVLKSVFTDALDPNSLYDVVAISFNIKSQNDVLVMNDELLNAINEISTRNVAFTARSTEEKLALLNNTIENILKPHKKFLTIDEENFFDFIRNEDIKRYRKLTHAFRHGSAESIAERKAMPQRQKEFLVNYGTLIVISLSNAELS